MNYRHCIQVCEAYRACSLRAEFVHSNEEGKANEAVLRKLENDELDVIVQVRKLGEGFDHPYLSVAAVFAVFSNLSPFVQFVGRIMRVVDQNNPSSLNNKGTVIYHAGSNIAKRWSDFQEFSQADQAYFSSLLPEESLDFASADELTVTPIGSVPSTNPIHVEQQSDILIEEIPLFSDDKARNAFEYLRSQGMTADQYKKALELEPIIPSRQAARTAGIKSINDQITIIAAGQLKKHGINGHAKDLDKLRLNRTNYELLVVTIHTNLNNRLGRKKGVRSQLNHEEIEVARGILDELAEQSIKEIQNGKT
jgi:hypothetical protein